MTTASDSSPWPLYLAAWIVFAILAAAVGASRGRPVAGLFLGLVCGPAGIVFALFLPAARARRRRR